MKSLFLFTTLLLAQLLFFPGKIIAESNCQPLYGGGQTCLDSNKITINSSILDLHSGQYEDRVKNFSYAPGEPINFRIIVKNVGNSDAKKIEVRDLLPSHVTGVKTSGNYEKESNSVVFNINALKKNEEKTFNIDAKIVSSGTLSSDGFCASNQAQVKLRNIVSSDNSQFCIKANLTSAGAVSNPRPSSNPTTIMPAPQITKTPATGPDSLALLLLGPIGLIGMYLKKRAISLI